MDFSTRSMCSTQSHSASTIGVHSLWIKTASNNPLLTSSITEANELSASIISSTRLTGVDGGGVVVFNQTARADALIGMLSISCRDTSPPAAEGRFHDPRRSESRLSTGME